MTVDSEFLARVLRAGARAYAASAAAELLEMCPEANEGLGPDPFSLWQSWLARQVEELAAAVAAQESRMFVSQVHWGNRVLLARGISAEHFRESLAALRRALERELPEAARPLAARHLDEALETFDEPLEEASPRLLANTPLGCLASTYLLAVLEGDRRRAIRVIFDALDRPESVKDLYLHVLFPAQKELGRMWEAGEINVAEEHFVSHTTKMVMSQLLARDSFEPPNGKTALAAAVAGNQHDVGVHGIGDFFEMAGWRTIQLGADVPIPDLVQAVEIFDADLLLLSAALSVQIETVRSTIQVVRSGRRPEAPKIIVGGGVFADFPHLAEQLGAEGYAPSPDEAVRLGCRLVGLPEDPAVD